MSKSPPSAKGFYLLPTGVSGSCVLACDLALTSAGAGAGSSSGAEFFVSVQTETTVASGTRGREVEQQTTQTAGASRRSDDLDDNRWATEIKKEGDPPVSNASFGSMCFVSNRRAPQTAAVFVCTLTLRSYAEPVVDLEYYDTKPSLQAAAREETERLAGE